MANDPTSQPSPSQEAFFQALAEQKKKDPLAGVKFGARELLHRFLEAFKDNRGVHVETLLTALGALAGYACQAALREMFIVTGKATEQTLFTVIEGDGQKYFLGDSLNHLLGGYEYSVWSVAAAGAQQAGCAKLPDMGELLKHVTATLCTPQFGNPRIPEKHRPRDQPIVLLQALWPKVLPLLRQFCDDPRQWPLMISLAIQNLLSTAPRTVIDPCLAVQIVMECAIPMSRANVTH
ncbi:MAG: hypothetical protein HQL66_08000 [Magnetococcales bacterium]|nr:hypothetical protein [Magnetococcales bacterium]